MEPNSEARLVVGAILFIDIDDYLSKVQDMDNRQELAWAEAAHRIVSEEAKRRFIQPVRTFGDAFLLFSEGPPVEALRSACLEYLGAIRSGLTSVGLSFKAAVAGGEFYVGPEIWEPSWSNARLSGALANLAGRKIRQAQRASVIVSWPNTERYSGLTYRQLCAGDLVDESVIPVDQL